MAKVRKKRMLGRNVYDKALDRIRRVYELFDHVVVSFSGGKDSTAVLNCTIEVARELGRLPVPVIFFDEEAIHPPTIDYVDRVRQHPDVDLTWYCLPIKHRNACSNEEPWWYCWDPEKRDLWVRPLPENDTVVTDHPAFKKGMTVPDFTPHLFSAELGSVCQLTGIRSQESLRRYRIVAMKKEDNYIQSTPEGKNVYKAHPIYDWDSADVWRLVRNKGYDYNRTYDIFNRTDMHNKLLTQRVCPPYGEEPLRGLYIYAECFPEMWHRMLYRVPGVATAWRYANTELYSVNLEQPPAGMNWKQYTFMLAGNYSLKDRKRLTQEVNRLIKLHQKVSTLDLADELSDPVSGFSWKFICKLVMRGDYKGRIAQAMQQEGEKTRRKKEIGLAAAVAKYSPKAYADKTLPDLWKEERDSGRIIP